MRRHVLTLSLRICLVLLAWTAAAPTAAPAVAQQVYAWEVYLERGIDETGRDRLIFSDTLSGEERSLEVYGERYTPLGRSVLFSEPFTNRVLLASADGTVREHPFIQPGAQTQRIDWVVSGDGQRIAWTLTNGLDRSSLSTLTTVANIDGTNPVQALADGPRDGFRALPISFNADNTILYMDMHPDGISEFSPYNQYLELFALDLTNGTRTGLPGEPRCFCGAGLGAGYFVRLNLSSDLSGFDVLVYPPGALTTAGIIPALRLNGFTQAGDVLVSPDGQYAIYALAQVENFGARSQRIRSIFALVDLEALTQRDLTAPSETFLRPLQWTDDNSAVLFSAPQEDGTWKVYLDTGRLLRIADNTYIGALQSGG